MTVAWRDIRDAERIDGSWLVLEYPDNPPIRLDACAIDRVRLDDDVLVMEVDEETIVLQLTCEPHTARKLLET
jgi:hypothetical protein